MDSSAQHIPNQFSQPPPFALPVSEECRSRPSKDDEATSVLTDSPVVGFARSAAPLISVGGGGGATMNRQFVHLVANHLIRGRQAYKLHLIDPSRFFYPTKPSNGSAGDGAAMEEFQLPPEAMTFYGPWCKKGRGYMDFMPLGHGNNKTIIGLDRKCRTIHCDAASLAVGTMPAAHAPKILPVSFPVGDSLYVLQRNSAPSDHHCFEALIHGEGPESRFSPDWYWHTLPPPPHVNDDESTEEDYTSNEINGHTVFGGVHIWISTTKDATYCFNTVTSTWSRLGNWAMPFSGRAEYVPELNLWLGFSPQDNRLCAADLATAMLQPPEVIGQWDDVAQPEEWIPLTSNIVPLGSGKMFIAKFFENGEKKRLGYDYRCLREFKRVAVFAGVELEKAGGELRMLKHKSMRYNYDNMKPHWVI